MRRNNDCSRWNDVPDRKPMRLETRMKFKSLCAALAAMAALTILPGCASTGNAELMPEVRQFAAESSKLSTFGELTARFRDTYKRELPYLAPEAQRAERETDARRRAAYDDFINIERAVVLYMQTLGKLAGSGQYELQDQATRINSTIKAWPESGIDTRHANAYGALARLITRTVTSHYQQQAVTAMVNEGGEPLQTLLEAMSALLRYYDKTSDNERKTVLGMLEIEISYIDNPQNRLLATLSKVHYQEKASEYSLAGRRLTLAAKNLEAISQAHRLLVQHLAAPAAADAMEALEAGKQQARASRLELQAAPD
jgi:hypothetical protein